MIIYFYTAVYTYRFLQKKNRSFLAIAAYISEILIGAGTLTIALSINTL